MKQQPQRLRLKVQKTRIRRLWTRNEQVTPKRLLPEYKKRMKSASSMRIDEEESYEESSEEQQDKENSKEGGKEASGEEEDTLEAIEREMNRE